MARGLLLLTVTALFGCQPDMDEMMNGGPMDGGPMDASVPVDMSPAEVDVYVPTPAPMGALRVNHLQMRGTVDSYHTVDDLTCCGDAWDFVHPSLDVQAFNSPHARTLAQQVKQRLIQVIHH